MDLRTTQLKDTYGNLVTTGTTAGAPTSGGLQNGQGTLLTSVGIGTASPATALEVRNDTTNLGRIRVSSSATTAGNYRGYEFSNGSVFKGGLLQDQSTDMISLFTPIGGQSVNISSSGNVGIGATSVTSSFRTEIAGGDFRVGDTQGEDAVEIGWSAGDTQGFVQAYDRGDSAFRDLMLNDSLLIESGGNVGINNTSPSSFLPNGRELVLGNGSASHGMTIFSDSSGTGNLFFADGTTGDEAFRGFLRYNHADDAMIIFTAGANERMRIDSSGNTFVNYSNGAIHTYGSGVFGGKTVIKASNDNALALLSSTVGGSAQVALNFTNEFTTSQYNYLGRIIAEPTQSWTSDAATRDSDLTFFTTLNGVTAEKMRILSSGGITFNGDTADANALDDYEEGTWTPAFTASGTDFTSVTYDTSFTGGKYTKIGDLVHIQGAIMTDAITVGSASGSIQISGLPFATSVSINGRDGFISLSIGVAVDFAGDHPVTIYSGDNTSVVQLMTRNTANGATVNVEVADLDTGVNKNIIYFAGTYKS